MNELLILLAIVTALLPWFLLVMYFGVKRQLDEVTQKLARVLRELNVLKARGTNPLPISPAKENEADAGAQATPVPPSPAPITGVPPMTPPPASPPFADDAVASSSRSQSEEAGERAPGDAAYVPLDLSKDSQIRDEQPRDASSWMRDWHERSKQAARARASDTATGPADSETDANSSTNAQADAELAGAAAAASVSAQPAEISPSWEERFGARLPVWIGAVALALAGVFLVRYFAQIGLLGPAVRVAMAFAFGLSMLGLGEWLRTRQARIAHGLTAAGVAVLYAALFSSVRVHALLHPGLGFVLMALVTAAAIALSLRHGPFVALLGLVGGFIMPGLLSTGRGNVAQLYTYLLLLEVGLIVLTRARRWWWIGTLTMLAGFGWAIMWLALGYNADESVWIGLYLLGSIAVFVVTLIDSESTASSNEEISFLRALPWAAAAAGLLLVAWLVRAASFSTLEWSYFAVLGAGCLVLARLRSPYFALACSAAVLTIVMLIGWSIDLPAAEARRFVIVLASMATLYTGGAYASLWGDARPGRWTMLCTLSAVAAFLLGYYTPVAVAVLPFDWWILATLLAGLMAALAVPIYLRRAAVLQSDEALALLLAGATFSLCFAAHLFVTSHELGRQWVTIAWALQLPILAWLTRRLRVPQLQLIIQFVAVLVAIRLLINPAVFTYDYGKLIVVNGIWYVYGVPVACFLLAAKHLKRDEKTSALARSLGVGAIVLLLAMIAMLVRHGFHTSDMMIGSTLAFELSTYATALGVAGLVLLQLGRRWERPDIAMCGGAAVGLLLLASILGAGIIRNPILNRHAVGDWPFVNGLLYLFGVPAILAVFAAFELRRHKALAEFARVTGVSAAVLMLGLVAMQVRHGFGLSDDAGTGIRLFEFGTYAAAYGVTGLIMFMIARRWPGAVLEQAAAIAIALMLLFSLAGAGFVENPLFQHRAVGPWPILNGLLYLYGLPGLICLAAARQLRRYPAFKGLDDLTFIAMLVLFFALITLQVRQAFNGTYLDAQTTSNSEWYTYSAAWLLYAATLLALGIRMNQSHLRWASLAVLLLAVAKVFLLDTRQLDELWRVLSFFGLGVSLMLIAWVYQRFVFRKPG